MANPCDGLSLRLAALTPDGTRLTWKLKAWAKEGEPDSPLRWSLSRVLDAGGYTATSANTTTCRRVRAQREMWNGVFAALGMDFEDNVGLPHKSLSHRGLTAVSDEQVSSADEEYWVSTQGTLALCLFWHAYKAKPNDRDYVDRLGRAFLSATLKAPAADSSLDLALDHDHQILCDEDAGDDGECCHFKSMMHAFQEERSSVLFHWDLVCKVFCAMIRHVGLTVVLFLCVGVVVECLYTCSFFHVFECHFKQSSNHECNLKTSWLYFTSCNIFAT